MTPTLYIMRGLPGSGKSTKAKQLLEKLYDGRQNWGAIISTDNYFIRPDGHYDFNGAMLTRAHEWAFQEFKSATEYASGIVLDNTNIKREHFARYVAYAREKGYEVEEVVVGEFTPEACRFYANRNVHGVPLASIERMAQGFEP